MKRTKFYLHSVWVEDIINGSTIGNIPDSVKLECFQAISHYGFYRNFGEVELSDMAKGLLAGIVPQLEGGWEAYEKQCERNKENAKTAGAPKGNRNAKKGEAKGNNPKQSSGLFSIDSIKHSDSDIDSESDSELDLDSDKIKIQNQIQNKIKGSKESANAPKKDETLSLKHHKASISLEDRKKAFGESIRPYKEKYGRELCTQFFDYWTEPNKSKTKMRFELEKTWEIGRRLATWAKRNAEWSKAGKQMSSSPESKETIDSHLFQGETKPNKEQKREAMNQVAISNPDGIVARTLAKMNKVEADVPYIDDKHKFDHETGW